MINSTLFHLFIKASAPLARAPSRPLPLLSRLESGRQALSSLRASAGASSLSASFCRDDQINLDMRGVR